MRYKKIWKKTRTLILVCAVSFFTAVPVAAQEEKRAGTGNVTAASQAEATEVEEDEVLYTPEDFRFQGVICHEGYRFTWYSERVLPGDGLVIPGRHADELGYICDEDGFICVASRDFEKGTEVDTPFGKKGKVYDWCAVSGTIDIYVNW